MQHTELLNYYPTIFWPRNVVKRGICARNALKIRALVPKSVIFSDLERRMAVILRYFTEFGIFWGQLRHSDRVTPLLTAKIRIVRHCVAV